MLSNETLVNIIKTKRANAMGPDAKELSQERAKALDIYHGRPDGHEQEGQSKVVTRDAAETVGWVLPTILRTFMQSGSLAEFMPVGDEDEDAAEQETDYTNHVIMKDNDGFMLLHDTAWDALVLKNCYAKHWWNVEEKTREKTYEDVSLDELTLIMMRLSEQYQEVSISKAESDEKTGLITVTLKLKSVKKRCKIMPTPPEELRVSNTCRGSLQDADFVEHFPYKTRSDLIAMGMDKEWVKNLPAKGGTQNTEQQSRNTVSDEGTSNTLNGVSIDMSMDEMDYCETYLLVDADEDGVAELRKIITVDNQIPDGDEWNEQVDAIPFTGGVTKRIPHRHTGESLIDDLKDLQKINTSLLRQALTNIWLNNHMQWLVNDRVDEPTFYTSGPGDLKRIKGNGPVGDAAMPVPVQPLLNQILPAIDHVNAIKENRTGISRTTTGLDPDTLREATKGAFLENLNRASQKVELIVRTYAETFVKPLVLQVHGILLNNQDEERIVKMRGKYVPVKPDEWIERTDLTVRVGLGTGNNEDKMQKLSILQGLQQQMLQHGMASPEDIYALFADMAKTLGEDTPEKYATHPSDPQFMQNKQWLMGLAIQQQQAQQGGQQQGNPLAEAEQVKGQFKLESERMSLQQKAALQQQDLEHKAQLKMVEMQHKQEIEGIKESMRHDIERRRIESQEAIETMREEVKIMIAGEKMDLGKPGIGAGVQDGQ